MDDLEVKTLEVKTDAKGAVSAEIATLGVVDDVLDLTMPGFFGTQQVKMFWNHGFALDGASQIPIGKGQVSDVGIKDGGAVPFVGKFNLDLDLGREAHAAVKFDIDNGPPMQEWSYGYKLLEGGFSFGDIDGERVRILQPRPDGTPGAEIKEVSPVMIEGAGVGTRTVDVKSGMRFADQADAVLAVVSEFKGRAEKLVTLRAEDGRKLSKKHRQRLESLGMDLKTASDEIERLLLGPADADEGDLMDEFLRYQKLEAQLLGVSTE